MPDTTDLFTAVFAKTELGQQEIQSRALGLPLLARRILVLVDGKKTGSELAVFLPNGDGISELLEQLLSLGCVRVDGSRKPSVRARPEAANGVSTEANPVSAAELSGLFSAEERSVKENEMARNFMINSINSIIGQQMRISLITDIAAAKTTEELRTVYLAWEASMADHGMGKRRLPELKEKLFKVL